MAPCSPAAKTSKYNNPLHFRHLYVQSCTASGRLCRHGCQKSHPVPHGMPFPEPETTIRSTIVVWDEECYRPGNNFASWRFVARSTNFQQLARFLNHFHEDSTTYKSSARNNT